MACRFLISSSTLLLVALGACAWTPKAPPGGDYRKVSELVRFPDFYPGLGTLYVQPKTLPVGPFRSYDRNGSLVSTIYMIPINDLDAHTEFEDLQASSLPVNHVDIYYNSGHPGVDLPHYHIILWHVSSEQAEQLK